MPTSVVIVGGERSVGASLPGPKGVKGEMGWGGGAGATGPAGQGVATGGSDGQVLKKDGATPYVTAWRDSKTALSIGTYKGSSASPQSFAGGGAFTTVVVAAADTSASVAPSLSVNGEEVTMAQDGFYEVTGSVRLAAATNAAERYLAVQLWNGSAWKPVAEATSDRSGVVLNAGVTLRLLQGQKVRMVVLNSTTNAVVADAAENPPRLSVVQQPTTQPS